MSDREIKPQVGIWQVVTNQDSLAR